MNKKIEHINPKRNVELSCWLHSDAKNRPAMLVIPGGRYEFCAPLESEPTAEKFYKKGFQTYILKYSVGAHFSWANVLEDFENTMEYIQNHSGTQGTDPSKICVCGYSAGGHLAACATSICKHKPAVAVLVYPAILNNVLKIIKTKLPEAHTLVNKETCPCFLAAAQDDQTVPIDNPLKMCESLANNSIPFELHIYSKGGHAFSVGTPEYAKHECCSRVSNWVPDSIQWIKEILC